MPERLRVPGVYLEGFSQGGMIAYNMANSAEVAREINIVGVYAQASRYEVYPLNAATLEWTTWKEMETGFLTLR